MDLGIRTLSAMIRGMRSEELPAGEGNKTQIRRVRTEDGHILVARLQDGGLVAFAPSCPHQVTPLDDATITECVLRCPKHAYLYEADTGENVHPARGAKPENMWKLKPGYLPTYEIAERDGWIWVSPEPKPAPEAYDPELEERAQKEAPAPIPFAPVRAGPEQSVRFVNVASGSTFEIRVPTNPREGYTWRYELVGDLLSVVDEQFEPGELPCQRVQLEASGVGATTLCCTYVAPETAEPTDIRTYIVRVQPA
jgi:nitrite reductase/ring-hydroxylating ferredoxin subunit